MKFILHKRGATFRVTLRLAASALDGAAVTATARCGDVVTDLDVRLLTDAPGYAELTAHAEDTRLWPVSAQPDRPFSPTVLDTRVEWPSGDVSLTETIRINVLPEVTE